MKQFFITIDTESDNQWDTTHKQTTENAHFIPRFQEICEKYGFKPTYLVDFSMCDDFFLQNYLKKKATLSLCEIGMHLHAWNTPPSHEIDTANNRPYLIEYPVEIMEKKIVNITRLLQNKFETEIVSHRAGRWATNITYFKLLEKHGYNVDCSVTPGIDWSNQIGYLSGGSNYLEENCKIHTIKGVTLVEVPVTVSKIHFTRIDNRGLKVLAKSSVKSIIGKNVWLRPSISSFDDIIKLINQQEKKENKYLEFMMHSPEFMPGGSPYYKSAEEIDHMFFTLEHIFDVISKLGYKGSLLKEANFAL